MSIFHYLFSVLHSVWFLFIGVKFLLTTGKKQKQYCRDYRCTNDFRNFQVAQHDKDVSIFKLTLCLLCFEGLNYDFYGKV